MKKILLMLLLISCNKIIKNINFKNKDINEELALAIINKDSAKAIELINEGANVNHIYSNKSIIELALDNENLYVLKEVLRKDVELNKDNITKIYDIALDGFDYDILDLIKGKYTLGEGLINNGKYFLLLCYISDANQLKRFMRTNNINLKELKDKINRNSLIFSAAGNKIDILKMLIEKYSFDINYKNGAGWTSLMYASRKGHKEVVKLLLEKGADINAKNKRGFTPLMLASHYGHTEIVELLIEKGANVNDINNGEQALAVASKNGHMEVVKLLIRKGVNFNYEEDGGSKALMYASRKGHKEVVKLLLEKGADINAKNKRGFTPLMLASHYGHTEIVELLLEKRTNVNDINNREQALAVASKNGHMEVVKLLIRKGINFNYEEDGGSKALMYAAQNGHLKIVELLLGKDTFIKYNYIVQRILMLASQNGHKEVIEVFIKKITVSDYRRIDFKMLFILSSQNGHREVVEFLIEKVDDINAKGSEGWNALMLASQNGHEEVVEILLEKGAFINFENSGWTALMLASKKGHRKVAELLIKKGADINAKDKKGFTPLMIASYEGKLDVIKALLNASANIDNRINSSWMDIGDSALTIAYAKGYKEIVELLVSKGANTSGLRNIEFEKILIKNIKEREINNCILMIKIYGNKINYKYKDEEGNTFLHYLTFFTQDINLFQGFLEKGCNINWRDNKRRTPIYLALNQENLDESFVLYLLEKGAIIDLNVNINNKSLLEIISQYEKLYNKIILEPLIEKFFNDLNLLDNDKNNLKEVLKILKIKEEDFKDKNKNLMIKFVKDTIGFNNRIKPLNVCEISTLSIVDNSVDVDFNIDVFTSILANLTLDDFDESIRADGIDIIKKNFINRLKDIKNVVPINQLNKPIKPKNTSYEDLVIYESNMKKYSLDCIKFTTKKQLYKLGLLISIASEKDKENIKWSINIILRHLVCPTGTLEAINYAVKCLINQDKDNDLRDALSKEIMEFRINLIKEVAEKHLHNKAICISELGKREAEYTNHMLAYLVMDLSKELKVAGLYENEFRYEYNKEFVINEVKKLYKERLVEYMVNLIREDARLSNTVRDYLEKEMFKTSSYLIIEDYIHDDEYKIKDSIIKILLIYFGYIK